MAKIIDQKLKEFESKFCDWNRCSRFESMEIKPKLDWLNSTLKEVEEVTRKKTIAQIYDKRHWRKVSETANRVSETADGWFLCRYCAAKFSTRHKAAHHAGRKHGLKSIRELLTKPKEGEGK